MPPTLNNSQNLNLDFLAASFWVQWTRAHGSAGKCLISVGNNDLCKLGEEYLNASICKFVVYSLQNSETFDVSHVIFLLLTIAELSTLKQVRFGPPCICRKWIYFAPVSIFCIVFLFQTLIIEVKLPNGHTTCLYNIAYIFTFLFFTGHFSCLSFCHCLIMSIASILLFLSICLTVFLSVYVSIVVKYVKGLFSKVLWRKLLKFCN